MNPRRLPPSERLLLGERHEVRWELPDGIRGWIAEERGGGKHVVVVPVSSIERLAFERLMQLRHPHLAPVVAILDGGDFPAALAERHPCAALALVALVPGGTLASRRDAGPVPPVRAVAYALRLLDALEQVYEAGLDGLTFSAETLVLEPKGKVIAPVWQFAGGVRLESCEPVACINSLSRSLWSFHIVLLEAILGVRVQSTSDVARHLPALHEAERELAPYLRRALSTDAAERPCSFADVRSSLEAWEGGDAIPLPEWHRVASSPPRTPSWLDRPRPEAMVLADWCEGEGALRPPEPSPLPSEPLHPQPSPAVSAPARAAKKAPNKRSKLPVVAALGAAVLASVGGWFLWGRPVRSVAPVGTQVPVVASTVAPSPTPSARAANKRMSAGECARAHFEPPPEGEFSYICDEPDLLALVGRFYGAFAAAEAPHAAAAASAPMAAPAASMEMVSDEVRGSAPTAHRLGWYELPVMVLLCATCCDKASPWTIAEPDGECPAVTPVFQKLVRAADQAVDLGSLFREFDELTRCYAAHPAGNSWGYTDVISDANRSALRVFLRRNAEISALRASGR